MKTKITLLTAGAFLWLSGAFAQSRFANYLNGYTTTSSYSVGISSGAESIQISSSEVKVYPSPANEYTVIEALGFRIDKIELVNLLGQIILTNEVDHSVAKINTTHLSNGTYFIKIYFNNYTVTKKINISK